MKNLIETENPSAQYLTGFADAKLKEAETIDTVMCSLIPDYNLERFETLAIRGYLAKEFYLTVYALDKSRMGNSMGNTKLPVKKFKIHIDIEDFIALFSNLNFTMSTGDYDIENMEVINK